MDTVGNATGAGWEGDKRGKPAAGRKADPCDLPVCNFLLWPSGAQAQEQRKQIVGFTHG